MMAFLLFLVGCTILFNNSNKHIDLIWLDAMQDLARIHEWSRDGMKLANLYHFLSKAIDVVTGSLDGYVTLVELVIYCFYICCISYYNMLI